MTGRHSKFRVYIFQNHQSQMYVCFYCAQDEDCYLPLSTDLRDMKAIQTLLVRKRKWKAKAKPMVAFTDLKDASLTKEGECSVLQVCKEYIPDSEICVC